MERTAGIQEAVTYRKTLSFAAITVQVIRIGTGINILVKGGGEPHIGSTVLAVPRPSLKEEDSISATASVLNVTGHKDELLCRFLAERIAGKNNAVVVCTGGFHMDGINDAQIQEVLEAVKEIGEMIEIAD